MILSIPASLLWAEFFQVADDADLSLFFCPLATILMREILSGKTCNIDY